MRHAAWAKGAKAYVHKGCADTRHLLNNSSTLHGDGGIDTRHGGLGACDLHQEDRLQDAGRCSERSCIDRSAGGGNDLATSSVDGICMENHVHYLQHTYTVLHLSAIQGGKLLFGCCSRADGTRCSQNLVSREHAG
jgi:hypothetical protein